MNNKHVLIGSLFLASSLIINASDATQKGTTTDKKAVAKAGFIYLPQIQPLCIRRLIGEYAKIAKAFTSHIPTSLVVQPSDHLIDQVKCSGKIVPLYDPEVLSETMYVRPEPDNFSARAIQVLFDPSDPRIPRELRDLRQIWCAYKSTQIKYNYGPDTATGQLLLDKIVDNGAGINPRVSYIKHLISFEHNGTKFVTNNLLKKAGFLFDE